jgi:pimeloyl-ACP methyl ester carboxylesterase
MKKVRFLALVLVLVSGFSTALAAEKWASFDGGRLHYYDVGKSNKRAVVFIHGWTCSADFWAESLNAFPGYRVIALDLPGHGKSDKPKTTYSMEYFARGVEAVLRDAKVEHAVLVGHSMGTPIARQYYRLFPSKVAGIVIVDGSLTPFFSKEQGDQMMAAFQKDFKGTSAQFVNGMIKPIASDAIKKKITDAMLNAPEYVSVSAMQGMMDSAIWTNDKVNVPVLAIMAQSPWYSPDTEKTFRTIAPDLEFHLWTGVTHFLMMEKPKEFNDAVRSFVLKKKLL